MAGKTAAEVYGKPWSKSQNAFLDNTLVQGDSVVMNHRHRVTTSEINAGHTVLPAVPGQKYRLIDFTMIAYGGSAATATAVTILATQTSSVALATVAVGGLTQSTIAKPNTATHSAVLADGASFVANDENTAITVGKTGGTLATCTGVDFIITYVLETA